MRTGTLTISVLLLLDVVMLAGPQAMVKPATDGRGAAVEWLRLVNAGRYAASWNQAAKSFQSRLSKAAWIAGMEKARTFYGKVLSRKFKKAAFDVNPPGFPSGEYETLWYKTRLAIAGTALEVVSMEREDGGAWRVSAFYIVPEKKVRFLPLKFLDHR